MSAKADLHDAWSRIVIGPIVVGEDGILRQTFTLPMPVDPENARLRALIKDAEWQGDVQEEMACPWCHAERDDDQRKHAADCPAFTVEGLVR